MRAQRSVDAAIERPTAAQRRADALALVAQSALAGQLQPGNAADQTRVVLHVDAEALADPEAPGRCAVEGVADVSAETARWRSGARCRPATSAAASPDATTDAACKRITSATGPTAATRSCTTSYLCARFTTGSSTRAAFPSAAIPKPTCSASRGRTASCCPPCRPPLPRPQRSPRGPASSQRIGLRGYRSPLWRSPVQRCVDDQPQRPCHATAHPPDERGPAAGPPQSPQGLWAQWAGGPVPRRNPRRDAATPPALHGLDGATDRPTRGGTSPVGCTTRRPNTDHFKGLIDSRPVAAGSGVSARCARGRDARAPCSRRDVGGSAPR